ncbi:MAG: patatin-like phospholipase family protein [Bacilli bacterium]
MYPSIKNLVFEGGGVLGTAYLGTLDYLEEAGLLASIDKVAGASSGAITACLASFNMPFAELKKVASTLDYKKIPQQEVKAIRTISTDFKKEFESLFGDINCIYRLINSYGWYSTEYFYDWVKNVISTQFDKTKKKPPYTFEDFQDSDLHINGIDFKDLYIIGTDISYKTSAVFSYETTPKMEVAKAVRISMSVPLFFESIEMDKNIFIDGGVMRNYPINIFDYEGINYQTLGIQFINKIKYSGINNIIDYTNNLFNTLLKVQEDIYNNDYINQSRSITINTGGISALDFNITASDYQFLYKQGYDATADYFESRNSFTY